MTLSLADKRWLRKMVREELQGIMPQLIDDSKQLGGYDGATSVIEDDWADGTDSRPRIGFRAPDWNDAKTP